jgi:hypothetical protein
VDRPTFADEFLLAVAVAIGDARRRFAQDDTECDAWAGYALFTNNLHAGNSGSGKYGQSVRVFAWQKERLSPNGKTLRRYRHRALRGHEGTKNRNVNSCFLDEVSCISGEPSPPDRSPIAVSARCGRRRPQTQPAETNTQSRWSRVARQCRGAARVDAIRGPC